MLVFAIARHLLSLAFRRGRRGRMDDAANMGTAFGLDASTFLEPETPEEIAARETGTCALALRAPAAPSLEFLAPPRRN